MDKYTLLLSTEDSEHLPIERTDGEPFSTEDICGSIELKGLHMGQVQAILQTLENKKVTFYFGKDGCGREKYEPDWGKKWTMVPNGDLISINSDWAPPQPPFIYCSRPMGEINSIYRDIKITGQSCDTHHNQVTKFGLDLRSSTFGDNRTAIQFLRNEKEHMDKLINVPGLYRVTEAKYYDMCGDMVAVVNCTPITVRLVPGMVSVIPWEVKGIDFYPTAGNAADIIARYGGSLEIDGDDIIISDNGEVIARTVKEVSFKITEEYQKALRPPVLSIAAPDGLDLNGLDVVYEEGRYWIYCQEDISRFFKRLKDSVAESEHYLIFF